MLTEKYDFRITDQMTIPLRPHWIANDSYREKCKMLVLNRSKGEITLLFGKNPSKTILINLFCLVLQINIWFIIVLSLKQITSPSLI